jgi:transglutaminase-like putative cysteine protease
VIRLEQSPTEVLDFQIEEYARRYPFTYGADEMPDLSRAMERQYLDPEHEVDQWARQFLRHDGRTETTELLAAMTHAIRQNLTYVRREESGVQDPVRTLRLSSGSCRDFTVLMMEAVRSLGLAAHFVSGYLYVHEGGVHEGRRVGGGATHAWLRVYLPGAGWVEFDPTNGIVGNHDLIRVAVARDPRQAVPVSGTWTGFPSDSLGMTVEVEVTAETAPGVNRKTASGSRAAGALG